LRELNPYVPVKDHKGELNEQFISSFNVVVFCDHNIAALCDLNETCRKHNVKFIAVESRGLTGAMFCDFGNNFEIFDVDGENTVSNIVIDISNVCYASQNIIAIQQLNLTILLFFCKNDFICITYTKSGNNRYGQRLRR